MQIDPNPKKKAYGQETIKLNKLEKMECFKIPQNRQNIAYIKQFMYNISLYESNQEVVPIAFLAFTTNHKA
jgi:hypothetical protein